MTSTTAVNSRIASYYGQSTSSGVPTFGTTLKDRQTLVEPNLLQCTIIPSASKSLQSQRYLTNDGHASISSAAFVALTLTVPAVLAAGKYYSFSGDLTIVLSTDKIGSYRVIGSAIGTSLKAYTVESVVKDGAIDEFFNETSIVLSSSEDGFVVTITPTGTTGTIAKYNALLDATVNTATFTT